MKEMINLQTSLEFKKLLGNIILSFTTVAIAIVPPFWLTLTDHFYFYSFGLYTSGDRDSAKL